MRVSERVEVGTGPIKMLKDGTGWSFFSDGNYRKEREEGGNETKHLNENSMLALSMSVGSGGICTT